MTGPDTPTLGEIVRRLDDIVRRLDTMAREAAEREKLFVRTDVFEARQNTDAVQMRGLEQEVHSVGKRLDAAEHKTDQKVKDVSDRLDTIEERRRADRMWLLGSLVFPIIVLLVAAFLAARGVG